MRDSYLKHFFEGVRQNGPIAPFVYGTRYLSTLLGYTLRKSRSGPIEGDLCLTYNCNLRCEMCDLPLKHLGFSKEKRPLLGLEDYKKIIQSFYEIGTSAVAISGGEPFLHKDLFEIIRTIKSYKMICQITTNGWFITEKNIEELVNTGIDTITISIDGPSAEIHDKIRGKKDSFERAMNAIKLLTNYKGRRFKVDISSTLSPENISSFEETILVTKAAGADGIGFMPVHDIRSSSTSAPTINEEKKALLKKYLNRLCEAKLKDPFIESSIDYLRLFEKFYEKKPLPMRCMAGYTTLLIDCYGDIFPCFTYFETKRPFANLRDYKSLKDYWKSFDLKKARDEIRGCRECYWNCQVETNLLYKPFVYLR